MVNYVPAALIILSVFLSVFVGILLNRRDANALKEDVNRRFDQMDRRIDGVEQSLSNRIDGVEQSLSRRIDSVEKSLADRIDRVEFRIDKVEHRLELIETDQKQFFTVTGKMEGRIDELSRH